MQDIIENYLWNCQARGLSIKTIKTYNQSLQRMQSYLESIGIDGYEDIKPLHLEKYVRFLFKNNNTVSINNQIRNLKAFYTWMIEDGYLERNPFKLKQIHVERKPLVFVKDEELKMLLNALDKSKECEYRDFIIIQVLLDTGMRIGECLSLKTFQVDLSRKMIHLEAVQTKGKRSRVVFFGEKSRKLLRVLMKKNTGFLFPNIWGEQLAINTFERNLRKYQKRCGLSGITPKTFRNNFAKRFLMNGGDIYTLSKILGHSSIKITESAYLDLNEDDLKMRYISPMERIRF